MPPNLLPTLRVLPFIVRIKLLSLTGRFPPLPGGCLDEQTRLLRRGQEALGEGPLDQVTPAQARLNFRASFPILKSAGGLFERVDSSPRLCRSRARTAASRRACTCPGKTRLMPCSSCCTAAGL